MCDYVYSVIVVYLDSLDICLECVVQGDLWVYLCVCMICGYIGCCDFLFNRYVIVYVQFSVYLVICSLELGEVWVYCYVYDCIVFC